jgi:hypothetical protein
MSTRLFLTTLVVAVFVPFAASAQVDAGDDVVLECGSQEGTEYTLNGTIPEDDSVVFEWTTDPEVPLDNADTVTPTGVFPLGVTTVTLTATVGGGLPESDSATVTVEDTQPPVVRVRAEPHYLWPPNHELREVESRVRVQDSCSDVDDVTVELIDARSNEPDNGRGDGNTVDDIQDADLGMDDRNVWLRAERSGRGGGRIYTLTYRVTDGSGNMTEAETNIYVPHDAADLKDLLDDGDNDDEMEPICKRPNDAIEELTELFPGFGSVRNLKACRKVCRAWTKSCKQIAKGSTRCVRGEQRALKLIDVAECKDSDDREERRECVADVRSEAAQDKAELKAEALEARDTCEAQGQRCYNACYDIFDPVDVPVEDD